jgi:hypothetical protein
MATCATARYIFSMNVALRTPLTVDDYLAWARTQSDPPRTELINGQIVPISPERVAQPSEGQGISHFDTRNSNGGRHG